MNFNVELTDEAVTEVKKLAKKYRSFKQDFEQLVSELEDIPQQGEPLGKDCYKVRLAISATNKGKRSGARVIVCVKIIAGRVVVLAVYDKSELATISDKEIERRLANADLY